MRWIAIALVLAGCGKSPDLGPPCGQVVDHMLEVTKQQLVGHDDMVLGQRGAMIKQCEERRYSAAMRRCLVAAKTLADIASCRGVAKPDLPQRAAPASSSPPAPDGK